ncbi:MAG: helix-turn-helix domain-containing protein [Arachnia sp.]
MGTHHDVAGRDRILRAALTSFTEQGDAASIRQIAKRAEVSPALIQHHFGTKSDLRAACDDYVLDYFEEHVATGIDQAGLGPEYLAEVHRSAPIVIGYLSRLLVENSPHSQRIFDALVALAEAHLPERETSSVRDRAAVLVTMKLGLLLLRPHVERSLGMTDSLVGSSRIIAAQLDLLNPYLISPEILAAARKATGTEASR